MHAPWPRLVQAVAESGQALVLSTLVMGLVLLTLAAGITGATLLVAARAALVQATDAAALAVLADARIGAELRITYVDYACRVGARGTAASCLPSVPRHSRLEVTGGGVFAAAASRGFGPLPGWAEAAGCQGTVWPGPLGRSAGTYRVCTGQRLVSAAPVWPAAATLEQTAQVWLDADTRSEALLWSVTVTAVRTGARGQATVYAAARVRPGLWPFARVAVAETAWPGPP